MHFTSTWHVDKYCWANIFPAILARVRKNSKKTKAALSSYLCRDRIPPPPLTSSILYPRVEWFSIDCDFRNWTHCCRSGTLYEFNLKNRQTKFCFFNHRYLKNNFFLNLQIPSYLLHRTIDIKKIRNRDIELLVRPQNGQNWFLNSFFQEIIFIFSF